MSEGLTKKQYKELRKLEKMQSHSIEQKNGTFKWIAISAISALFLILFVGVVVVAKNKNKPIAEGQIAKIAEGAHVRKVTTPLTDASSSADPQKKEVTLVEYGDIQCPACGQYHPVVVQLLAAYPNQLKLVFKHFPLTSIHSNAMVAAIAAESAGKQGKFFEFLDLMYSRQNAWSALPDPQSKFEEYIKELKLNVDQFRKDQKDPAISKLINTDREEGIKNGVTGTPSFFVNGKKIENPADLNAFKKIIDKELKPTEDNAVASPQSTTAPDKLPLQQ